jgi:ABC-type multidrug transport system ATPase subunit
MPPFDSILSKASLSVCAKPYGQVQALKPPDLSVPKHSIFGFLPQQPHFIDDMSARETLRFTSQFFFSRPQPKIEEQVDEMLGLVGLQDKADRPVKGFSCGECQRPGLALARIEALSVQCRQSRYER